MNEIQEQPPFVPRSSFRVHRSCTWWVLRGSNSRHSPCKGDALPTELSTRRSREISASLLVRYLENWRKCRCAVQRSALVYCILECFSSAELGHFGGLDLDGRAG